MITAITAFVFDLIIGDPKSRFHPVALMGNFISFLEKLLYKEKMANTGKLICGGVLVALVIVTSYYIGVFLLICVYHIRDAMNWPYLDVILTGFFLSFTISPKSLAEAAREIYFFLASDDIKSARKSLSYIVGRDTEHLDSGEITRGVVETVAENTVDGIISPLFFFILGGLPLAICYRAANTMDSMLGYKNERYLFFGRAAARFDDVLNYIPARITGLLFVVSASFLKLDAKNALEIMKRDAAKHPSPNGGYAEASAAGALHIRLGGENSYFGKKTFRAYMGDPIEKLSPRHITLTIKLMYTATILFLIFAYVILI
ncbi:MAG: cobalamin biosynthesis protein CobD [Selenomonadaceae bacterium]|nr:cobalamin biosynthesis protein CobD [Selenomonadaceae bacterium]